MTERIVYDFTAIGITGGDADVAAAIKAERKRKLKLTKSDVKNALQSVQETGAEIGKVEVTREKITVQIGKADDATEARDASLVAMDRIAAMRSVK